MREDGRVAVTARRVRWRRLGAATILAAVVLATSSGGIRAQRAVPSDLALPADPRLGFVEIPAGPAVIGGSGAPEAFDNERWSATAAEGTVDVAAFLLGRREVTVAQFAAFAAAAGWRSDRARWPAPPITR